RRALANFAAGAATACTFDDDGLSARGAQAFEARWSAISAAEIRDGIAYWFAGASALAAPARVFDAAPAASPLPSAPDRPTIPSPD
ncbi:MAG: hypothetical protein KGQ28_05625, partial [Hyphomicrobiales bacterium]|nr:hypothetical protein [Hyphomicrobiales bacterium]